MANLEKGQKLNESASLLDAQKLLEKTVIQIWEEKGQKGKGKGKAKTSEREVLDHEAMLLEYLKDPSKEPKDIVKTTKRRFTKSQLRERKAFLGQAQVRTPPPPPPPPSRPKGGKGKGGFPKGKGKGKGKGDKGKVPKGTPKGAGKPRSWPDPKGGGKKGKTKTDGSWRSSGKPFPKGKGKGKGKPGPGKGPTR